MKTDIKKKLHDLIDEIDNDLLLNDFYEILKKSAENKDGQHWKSLSKEEQKELLTAVEESEQAYNLIDHNKMKEKHKKWL